jgi:hypothetical protein
MPPYAEALPALAAAALLVGSTLVLFAARIALLGRDPGAPSGFVPAWWRWLAGPREGLLAPRPQGPGVVSLDEVRRARAGRRARCALRPS